MVRTIDNVQKINKTTVVKSSTSNTKQTKEDFNEKCVAQLQFASCVLYSFLGRVRGDPFLSCIALSETVDVFQVREKGPYSSNHLPSLTRLFTEEFE